MILYVKLDLHKGNKCWIHSFFYLTALLFSVHYGDIGGIHIP